MRYSSAEARLKLLKMKWYNIYIYIITSDLLLRARLAMADARRGMKEGGRQFAAERAAGGKAENRLKEILRILSTDSAAP